MKNRSVISTRKLLTCVIEMKKLEERRVQRREKFAMSEGELAEHSDQKTALLIGDKNK